MVEVRSARRAADPAPQPDDRRGDGRRRSRAGEGGLVQPGLARRAAAAGDAAAALRQARPLRLSGRGARVRRRRAAAPGSTRPGSCPVHPATERLRAAADPRVGLAGAAARPARDRAAAGRAARPPPAGRRGRRAGGGALSRRPRRARSGRASGSPSRSCSCTRPRSRRAARDAQASRPGIALGRPGELVERWLASLPFELTGDQRRAIEEIDADLVAAAADAAAADGRGRDRARP